MTRYIKSFGNMTLYRNDRTGIAWINDPSSGIYSCHPNIYKTGTVKGMKKLGYWGKKDKTEKCGDYIYNISHLVCDNEWDKIVANECMCKCCIERRRKTYMKDYTSSAAALYDGGWREGDKEELIFEYALSEDEATEICTRLAEIEKSETE